MSITVDKPHNTLWDDARFYSTKKPARIPSLTSEQYITLIRHHYRHEDQAQPVTR